MDTTRHDAISDSLRREKYTAHHLQLAELLIPDSPEAYLIVDDWVIMNRPQGCIDTPVVQEENKVR